MKKIIFTILTILLVTNLFSQERFWSETSEDRTAHLEKLPRGSEVLKHRVFSLDFTKLQDALHTAVNRELNTESDLIISFPNANGELQKYRVFEAPIMHADLNQKHQNIKSYVGISLEDRTATIRFSTTIFGFHGMIFSGKTGTTYIDPYTKDLNNYVVYFKKHTSIASPFECTVESVAPEASPGLHFSPLNTQKTMLNGSLRKFRLAMACTTEYAGFHINAAGLNSGTLEQKKAAVLAAMNVTMTRVNGIYERDLSLTMELVPNNEDIIFIDADNFSNDNNNLLINQSQTVIDAIILSANYDIGHTVSTGAGGVAQLYSPCSASKARGVTGISAPVGDPFDVDYVSHEMGHQFGANHTQNNSCNTNNPTAIETGSGSTIMGYAGICAPNVQNNSDAYFHAISLNEIKNFLLSWGNCSDNISNENTKPTITPIPNYNIPKGTAFVLRGNGSDSDGDELTYCWEQTNNQSSIQPPSPTSTAGPNFRSLFPSESPDRYMPRLSDVLQGNLTPTWEVVPSVGRTMNFALTVRDNNINGGEYERANISVTTSGSIGPFTVTSQNSNTNWETDSQQTIIWDVAGTTNTPVNTSMVNILLSDNGGVSFDYVLAANTPNDGTETITVPNIGTSNARIMVEAVGNIFYAVNTSPFSIGNCQIHVNTTVTPIPDGTGINQPGATLISTINITDEVTLNNIKAAVNINHTYIQDLTAVLEHPNGTQVTLWDRNCGGEDAINVTFEQGAPAIICSNPTVGNYSPVGDLSVLDGLSSVGEWKLILTDYYFTDTGSLISWSLDLGCVANANTDNFNALNTKIYPNPNNGSFMVTFDSQVPEEINIAVFDVKGKKIFDKVYPNTGTTTNQVIDLTPAPTGVYIVKIKGETTSEIQKIIVR